MYILNRPNEAIQMIIQHSTAISIEILPLSFRATISAYIVIGIVWTLKDSSGVAMNFWPNVCFAARSDHFSTASSCMMFSKAIVV